MHSGRITPRASDDIKSIGRYTERYRGKTQRNIYLRDLESRFAWLAEYPLLGKKRSDITEGYFSFPQGEHVIFYLIGQQVIEIIGIPHKEMDVISYFQNHGSADSTRFGDRSLGGNLSLSMTTPAG